MKISILVNCVEDYVSKKLNLIMRIIFFIAIGIFGITRYEDFKHENQIYIDYINNLEKSTKQEYKSRLKESVETTIAFINAARNKIIKSQEKLLTQEIQKIHILINGIKEKEFNQFITSYKHDYIRLSLVKKDSKVQKKLIFNEQELYFIIQDELITNKLTIETREYLYNSISDDNRYVWVNKILSYEGGDAYATRLIHPNLKETEGEQLSTSMEDIKGNKPFLDELLGIKKDKEIYFEYFFKTVNSNDISKKLSYAQLYEEEDWIIATGIPLTNLKSAIEKVSQTIKEAHKQHFKQKMIYESMSTLLFIILFFLLKKIVNDYFNQNQKLKDEIALRLQVSENRANKFFDLSINLHLIIDLNGKVLHVNDTCKSILGYEKEELINTLLLDLLHPDDMEETRKERIRVREGQRGGYFENRYIHKNGNTIHLAWSAMVDVDNSEIYASAQNITTAKFNEVEIKKQELLLHQQSKMASMGEMIENISHQWKQPLSVISAVSSGIKFKNDLKELQTKDIDTSATIISDSIQYLSDTVDDFRDFFKHDKFKRDFSIINTFLKIDRLLKSQFEPFSINVIKNIDEIEVYGYENELIQVLINILNNARDELLKSLEKKKLILIEVKKNKELLEIIIKDNAGGISDKIIDKVFDSHFTTKADIEGTGIGLYMSKAIITEHMRGTIEVVNSEYSYEDKRYIGAEFKISIPQNLRKKP